MALSKSATQFCNFAFQAVLALVRHFGAFACVTVTSFRKVLSIVLSFLLFAKPFTAEYVYSGALVLVGIYLNLAAKRLRGLDARTLILLCADRARCLMTACCGGSSKQYQHGLQTQV